MYNRAITLFIVVATTHMTRWSTTGSTITVLYLIVMHSSLIATHLHVM